MIVFQMSGSESKREQTIRYSKALNLLTSVCLNGRVFCGKFKTYSKCKKQNNALYEISNPDKYVLM